MTQPDLNSCVLRLDDLNAELDRWDRYTFASDFLTPADAFSFAVGDPDIPNGVSGKIREGMKVTLLVDGRATCTGYIDEVELGGNRSGGTFLRVSGRDILGDVVDSCVDPKLRFSETQTILDIVSTVFEPFGIDTFDIDNDDNVNLITGDKYGLKQRPPSTSKTVRHRRHIAPKKLSTYKTHQCKPYPHEGAYEFCERLAKRCGLHIWARGDGNGVVISRPNFSQPAKFTLTRRRGIGNGTQNNIVDATFKRSRIDQPSIIIATGVGGGGEFGCGRAKVAMVNELIAHDADGTTVASVLEALAKHPDAVLISPTKGDVDELILPRANPYPRCRPLYLHDDASRDIEQLKNFVKREMAKRQNRAQTYSVEVEGHTQDGMTWAVDSMVNVNDEVAGINEPMWIKSVRFTKSRSEGTKTQLELILPYTLRL